MEEGDDPLHFGAVARLEHSARLLTAQEERDVVPVLVTGQAVSAKVAEIASDTGVRVVTAAGASSSAQMPSADDVLIAAIELALTGTELPQAATLPNGQATGTGFVAVPMAGAAYPRAAVTWHEDS